MKNQFTKHKRKIVSQLLKLYSNSTLEDREKGSQWYPQARRIITALSLEYGINERTIAAMVAVMSPQISWEQNIRVVKDILNRYPPSVGFKANQRKAQRILSDSATELDGYMKDASKVRAFFANLCGDYGVVTLDGHAIQAALDDITIVKGLKKAANFTLQSYYIQAASQVDEVPATFQASIWVTWKRLNPTATKRRLNRK